MLRSRTKNKKVRRWLECQNGLKQSEDIEDVESRGDLPVGFSAGAFRARIVALDLVFGTALAGLVYWI